ncbi:MAG TPA: hypothetical protein VM120_10725 [Bryobacteraceae bacterium]|nr:hypothetical protein [Bryobacteraceae bacterium]
MTNRKCFGRNGVLRWGPIETLQYFFARTGDAFSEEDIRVIVAAVRQKGKRLARNTRRDPDGRYMISMPQLLQFCLQQNDRQGYEFRMAVAQIAQGEESGG